MPKCIRCGKTCANGENMCDDCKAWFREKTGGELSKKEIKLKTDNISKSAKLYSGDSVPDKLENADVKSFEKKTSENQQSSNEIKTKPKSNSSHGRNTRLILIIVIATVFVLIVMAFILLNEKNNNPVPSKVEESEEQTTEEEIDFIEESTVKSATDVMENIDNDEELAENIESTESQTDIDMAPEITETNDPFYGVWIAASKDENEATVMSDSYSADGIETEIVVTSDWDNLNSEKYYALTAGKYMSQEDAEIRLSEVKDLGCRDAYVKYTGKFIGESTEITITNIEATSCLSEYDMTHSVERIHDGKLDQAWVEGADGQGIGEAVTFYFDDYCVIHDLIINAGYQKSEELYYKNSRPKILKVYYSDGTAELIELSDTFGVQDIVLSNGSATNSLKLEIESVYEGNTYQDTVISEVEFN